MRDPARPRRTTMPSMSSESCRRSRERFQHDEILGRTRRQLRVRCERISARAIDDALFDGSAASETSKAYPFASVMRSVASRGTGVHRGGAVTNCSRISIDELLLAAEAGQQ